jgi:predicted aldo/keto reductase-like oxidoreductase
VEQRRLGKTGLTVGVIGFGGLVVSGWPQRQVEELVGRALVAGVNYFDTAHSYGDSQEKLGAALEGKRDQVILGAKLIYRDAEEASLEIDHSLERLRTDHIDVYHLHAVDTPQEWEQVSAEDGALTALECGREAGKIRFLGITGHMPSIQALALRSGRLDTVMAATNYTDRFVYGAELGLHPLARHMGAGVFVLKPTAHGQIADRELAYRYVLSQDVDCVLTPREPEEFLLALEVAARFQPLSAEEERELLLGAPELAGRCRQCGFCAPCPEGLDIPFILRLAGWFERFAQTKEIAQSTYGELSVPADRCSECGVCEKRCPYGIPIVELLRGAQRALSASGR